MSKEQTERQKALKVGSQLLLAIIWTGISVDNHIEQTLSHRQFLKKGGAGPQPGIFEAARQRASRVLCARG